MLSITSLFSSLQNITVSQRNATSEKEVDKSSSNAVDVANSQANKDSDKDLLDLGAAVRLNRFQAMTQTYKPAPKASLTGNEESAQVETDKIEQIRVNKNSVISRINELLNENGVEIPEDQKFTVNLNLQTGKLDVSGIEDEELQQKFLEAIQGDEQLTSLLRKTREDLGLDYGKNVTSRNFGIAFDSMLETPVDAAVSYRLDINIDPADSVQQTSEVENPQIGQNAQDKRDATRFQISILMSNFIPEIPDLESATSDQVNPKRQDFIKGNMTSVQFSWLTQMESMEEESEEDDSYWQYHQQSWTSVSVPGKDGSSMKYELFSSQTLTGLPGQLQNSHNVLEDWLSWLNGANSQVSSLSGMV